MNANGCTRPRPARGMVSPFRTTDAGLVILGGEGLSTSGGVVKTKAIEAIGQPLLNKEPKRLAEASGLTDISMLNRGFDASMRARGSEI